MSNAVADANMNALQSSISASSGVNDSINITISEKNDNLLKKNQINLEQEKAIVDKQRLLLTRSRMLQVSMDKNAYRTKIMYTLIAIILFILIITFGMYVFISKRS